MIPVKPKSAGSPQGPRDLADSRPMPDLQTIYKQIPMPVIRGLTALGFLVFFFAIAAIIRPSASTAGDESQAVPSEGVRVASPSQATGAGGGESNYIGSLAAPDLKVDVFITPEGPRYTVHSISGKRILATLIDAEELSRSFPALGIGRDQRSGAGAPSERRSR